ncbi:MAG: hypothetical protein HQL58_11080 [Magnetococcales bacterium]|nr:hypothetical protein [Magnetococcales bacterium]
MAPQQKKSIALFFTAGISDLKFVAEDGSLLELAKVHSHSSTYASIREVHESLLKIGSDNIAIYPFDTDLVFDNSGVVNVNFLKYNDFLAQAPIDANGRSFPLQRLDDGRLLLAADKLLPIWSSIQKKQQRVSAVVGFCTKRDNRNDEPVAAEKLIFTKLVERLRPEYSDLVTYVKGQETLESQTGVFLPDAVARIEKGVYLCHQSLGDTKTTPWLTTTGGIPPVKGVLRAAIELHFGPVRSFQRFQDGAESSFYHAPQDSLVARRHALDFIRCGALIEAAAMAWSFRDNETERYWVHPLRCAARFLDGNPVFAYSTGHYPESAAPSERRLELPLFVYQMAQHMLPGGNQPQRRCLLVGLRAEAALRAGRWVDAINLSVTFHDAAIRDMINQKIGHYVGDREIELKRSLTPSERLTLCDTNYGIGQNDPCLRPIRQNVFRVWSSKHHDDVWCQFFGGPLKEMNDRLHGLREFRNRNTHDILSDNDIKKTKDAFKQIGLWQQSNQTNMLSFLDTDLPKEILRELGYKNDNPLDYIISQLEQVIKNIDTYKCVN